MLLTYIYIHVLSRTARYQYLQPACISLHPLDLLLCNQLLLYLFRHYLCLIGRLVLPELLPYFFNLSLQLVKIILNSKAVFQSKF